MNEEVGADAARVLRVVPPLEEVVRVPIDFRRHAEPRVPIEVVRLGHFGIETGHAPRALRIVAADVLDLRLDHLAEHALANGDGGRPVAVVRHGLHADLQREAGLFLFLLHGQSLLDGVRHRLFAVDRLSRLESGNRHTGVRMLGDGNRHVIDLFVVEHVSIIGDGLRRAEHARPLVGPRLPTVGDDDAFDVVALFEVVHRIDVRQSLTAGPHEADANPVIGADHAGVALGRQGGRRGHRAGCLQKGASRNRQRIRHGVTPGGKKWQVGRILGLPILNPRRNTPPGHGPGPGAVDA